MLSRFIDYKFFIKKLNNKTLYLYVYNRSWLISYHNLKWKYTVHKGNFFNRVRVSDWVLKKKFGEFSFTRKPFVFVKKEKKKKR